VSWKSWLAVGMVATVAVAVGAPFVYSEFISADTPRPLTLATPAPGRTSASTDPAGTWTVTTGSVVGYRVNEVLFGRHNEAVGRTNNVTGKIVVNGSTVRSGSFAADMTTVRSDQQRRDNQFHGRIMDTGAFPTATFTFTTAVELGSVPKSGEKRTFTVAGDLTLRGTTRSVTVELTGERSGSGFQVKGSIPIVFAEWNIPNPSFGPVTTEDNGVLEFALSFTHA
jgi:polyisoprenoid-binding protein YceI